MKKMRLRLARGFTLIEMLMVLAIVALLLSVALPRYFSALEKSKDVALQENLKVLRISIDRFFADKGRHPETLEELVEFKYLHAVPVDPVTESNASWVLVPSRDANERGIVDVKSGAPGTAADGKAYGSL